MPRRQQCDSVVDVVVLCLENLIGQLSPEWPDGQEGLERVDNCTVRRVHSGAGAPKTITHRI